MSEFVYIHDCSSENVTTSSYVEIIPSSPVTCNNVQFFYFITTTALGLAALAIGGETEEEDVLVCSQKVGTAIPVNIEMGSRVSLKAIGSDITNGFIILTLIQ